MTLHTGVNLEQMAATVASIAITGGFVLTIWSRVGVRNAKRIEEKVRKVTAEAITKSTNAVMERIDDSDKKTAEQLDDLHRRSEEDRIEMAKQFGGNSDGARQAIDKLSESVHRLSGSFEQHIRESGP
jgi:hypothetical protein